MSPPGRPKGELTAGREPGGFVLLPPGRPKGESTALRSTEVS